MSIATTTNPLMEYVKELAAAGSPEAAVQIAIAHADREKAIAASAQAEYRALAELEFDSEGRIAKANLGGLWRLAQMYAGSDMVPEHYRRKPNDCFIACQMAFRLHVDTFAYMQSSYVVHGKPGIEAKLSVAMLNTSGKIVGRVRYREERDEKTKKMTACTAYAIDKETGEEVSARIDWAMVIAEGWLDKKGSKWQTMPDIMFHYRSATFLIRQYYPEVLMGMRTVDELEDIGPSVEQLTEDDRRSRPRNLNDLAARLEGPSNGNGPLHGVLESAELPNPPGTEAAAETTAPQGETTEAAAETTAPAADTTDLLEELDAALANCQYLSRVGKHEEEFRARTKDEGTKAEISRRCDVVRAAKKAEAAKSKGQQPVLPGAT